MGCGNKIELNVCQITSLISICVITTLLAIFGWFRDINLVDYKSSSGKSNNVTSFVHIHRKPIPYLDDIGSPPLLNDPHLYVQWTMLQMNDVYELIPLAGGKKGGLARVATIRKLLLKENPNTITVIAGDVLSPSAIGMKRSK